MQSTIDLIPDFLRLVENPSDTTNQRKLLSDADLSTLRKRNLGILDDYLSFLAQIGWGSFRESTYRVYSGFVLVDEILPAIKTDYEILCFGDDFRGDPAAFIPSQNWKLVEIFHEDYDIHCEEQTFTEFIAERLFMSMDGHNLSQIQSSEPAE